MPVVRGAANAAVAVSLIVLVHSVQLAPVKHVGDSRVEPEARHKTSRREKVSTENASFVPRPKSALQSRLEPMFMAYIPLAFRDMAVAASEDWMAAFSQSFCVVGVAELFDKTWFVALLYAISLGRRAAFIGSYSALLLHTVIAAALGFGFSQVFKVSTLHFITTSVFAIFAVLYTWEWLWADPSADALADRADEARGDLGEDEPTTLSKTGTGKLGDFFSNKLAWQCFVAVFIAEWGDRTQIAMIALHASLPLLPVCIGSAAAFFVLTLSAVIVAAFLEGIKLSERLVLGISALSFAIFACLAFHDGLEARHDEMRLS